TEAEIIWAPPLEAHPSVLKILNDRIRELSNAPAEEVLLLVGHGSEWPGFKERCEGLLTELGQNLVHQCGLKGFSYATLTSKQLAERVKLLTEECRTLVIP